MYTISSHTANSFMLIWQKNLPKVKTQIPKQTVNVHEAIEGNRE